MGSTETNFIWDGQNIVAEANAHGVFARYYRSINLIARQIDANMEYYHFNAHGDVVQRTDNQGGVLKSYDYDAFGMEKNPETLDSNPFRYCGEYYDREAETPYLRARNYDPRTGRFDAEDPIRDGLNWYTYCANNPILLIDPSGLEIQLQGSDEERQRILAQIRKLTDGTIDIDDGGFLSYNFRKDSKTPISNELIQRLIDSKYFNVICENTQNNGNSLAIPVNLVKYLKNGSGAALINFDTINENTLLLVNPKTGFIEEKSAETYILLAHELIHADRMNRGTYILETSYDYVNMKFPASVFGVWTASERILTEEIGTMGLLGRYSNYYSAEDITENLLRQEHDLWPRGSYSVTFSVLKNSEWYSEGWWFR